MQNFMNLHTNTYHSCCMGVHTAGVAVIAVPKFAAGQQFGQMVVADVIYTKVNDTPYDFMQ